MRNTLRVQRGECRTLGCDGERKTVVGTTDEGGGRVLVRVKTNWKRDVRDMWCAQDTRRRQGRVDVGDVQERSSRRAGKGDVKDIRKRDVKDIRGVKDTRKRQGRTTSGTYRGAAVCAPVENVSGTVGDVAGTKERSVPWAP
jgi:hypothetical protein